MNKILNVLIIQSLVILTLFSIVFGIIIDKISFSNINKSPCRDSVNVKDRNYDCSIRKWWVCSDRFEISVQYSFNSEFGPHCDFWLRNTNLKPYFKNYDRYPFKIEFDQLIPKKQGKSIVTMEFPSGQVKSYKLITIKQEDSYKDCYKVKWEDYIK
jgi:hypothetical protein